MHDGMQYDPIQGQAQGHEPLTVGNPSICSSYLLRHLYYIKLPRLCVCVCVCVSVCVPDFSKTCGPISMKHLWLIGVIGRRERKKNIRKISTLNV